MKEDQHRMSILVDRAEWKEARRILFFRCGITFSEWVRQKMRELIREERRQEEKAK